MSQDVAPQAGNANPPLSSSEPILRTSQLKKTYRTGFWLNKVVTPLKSCSLTVQSGETFGLLGPNGAGKTTLLKILLGIIYPSGGQGQILGKPLGDRSVKQYLGYLPENAYFYDYLTGWEFLEFVARLFQIPRSVQKTRIPELLDLVALDRKSARKKQMRQYSKGMLQRIGVAQALMNDPKIIFLDEPMSGLDPLGRSQVRDIIVSLKAQGKTVFFNSHVLSDVESICDRVAILALGELLCAGSLDELLGQQQDSFRVTGQGGDPEQLRHLMADVEFHGSQWRGQYVGDPEVLLRGIHAGQAQILSLSRMRQSLEDFFLHQLRARGIHTSR
ncbi:ABC transporter ATP-binding protein [Lyngbya confervoides]|uniref:ABC transporter ATP-binding protein n=1 Tax=Lyngbya confervoides BDU141951 TaxID=1574623 RepID=A0ABD4T593_9CYAN|nr:ABC transporter ATP-binding protein [Lyngbya confervoides]MCM1983806.1 ABC transporter ATP-binding protein [Lyngbya confervoides BDU141951]